MPTFNKGALYNFGLEAAGTVDPQSGRSRRPRGDDIFSFIDADSVVGIDWLAAAAALRTADITRLCYRVRYIPRDLGVELLAARTDVGDRVDDLFSRYDQYRLAYEAYGDPDRLGPARRAEPYWTGRIGDGDRHELTDGPDNPHGNSQFAIRRGVLGDIRYDAAYAGRGFGDLDINHRIAAAHGAAYRGAIDIHPTRCMFHLTHDYAPRLAERRDPPVQSPSIPGPQAAAGPLSGSALTGRPGRWRAETATQRPRAWGDRSRCVRRRD